MKTPEQNAIEFINAYQHRHSQMTQAFEWRRRDGREHESQAYWKWRSEWLVACLHHCPGWARNQTTLQRSDVGYMAVGADHVKSTRSVL